MGARDTLIEPMWALRMLRSRKSGRSYRDLDCSAGLPAGCRASVLARAAPGGGWPASRWAYESTQTGCPRFGVPTDRSSSLERRSFAFGDLRIRPSRLRARFPPGGRADNSPGQAERSPGKSVKPRRGAPSGRGETHLRSVPTLPDERAAQIPAGA